MCHCMLFYDYNIFRWFANTAASVKTEFTASIMMMALLQNHLQQTSGQQRHCPAARHVANLNLDSI